MTREETKKLAKVKINQVLDIVNDMYKKVDKVNGELEQIASVLQIEDLVENISLLETNILCGDDEWAKDTYEHIIDLIDKG